MKVPMQTNYYFRILTHSHLFLYCQLMFRSKKFFLILFACLSLKVFCQSNSTFQIWTDYSDFHKLNGNWQFFNDAGYRIHPSKESNQFSRLHIRPSIEFKRQVLYSFRGGIGLFYTINSQTNNTFEFRPWQGFRLNWPNINRVRIVHYVRLEERFTNFLNGGESAFTLKFRYKLQTKIPLNNPSMTKGTYYAKISAEIFADLALVNKSTNNDRNRFELGGGYLIKRNLEIQLIYLLQRNKNNIEGGMIQNDNVVRISVIQRFGID